jgi:hypothetical protein
MKSLKCRERHIAVASRLAKDDERTAASDDGWGKLAASDQLTQRWV